MYIDIVPNRSSPPAVLLREAWREGGKIRKRTIANLSKWPPEKVQALRQVLKGQPLVRPGEAFAIERSLPQGHVQAVLGMMQRLGLASLIASQPSRQRDLVMAMIAQRLIDPCSKLASTRLWHTTTLAGELGVEDADVDELYRALDWLLAGQGRIEKKLARRHLNEGDMALYDVTSSYYEGRTCVLACWGHNRDGKEGTLCIVYGVMTDVEGRPVGVEGYPGNTGDPTTVPSQVDKLRRQFAMERVVLVGDRGMLTQTQIEHLRRYPQLGWISALRSASIRQLVAKGDLQLSLFDRQDLAEITSADFPGERLVVCFNPLLADERRRKREELLAATEKELAKVARAVGRRTRKPLTKEEVGVRVGKVIDRFKMAKHLALTIEEGRLDWRRQEESIAAEQALDGIYVIRTSEPAARLSSEDAVRGYKGLSHVERAFRTLKGLDLMIRPIHLRTEDHVRAHIFLCMLAYYVEWHLRKALAPLLFDDEELDEARRGRDPVKPAQPSASAQRKKQTRETADGLPVQSFRTLLAELGTRCRNTCRMKSALPDGRPDRTSPTFDCLTEPTALQARALELVEMFPVAGN
jgi:transposase